MTGDESLQFVEHLRHNNHLTKTGGNGERTEQGGSERSQGKLWELTDLSASEFADEAARFFDLDRVTLQDMLSAAPMVAAFSQRFLREMMVFPYQSADGGAVLAVADPTDTAARRAAEIVLRADVAIKVASVEDLTIVLDQRLGGDDVELRAAAIRTSRAKTISKACGTLPAVRPLFAPSMICWRKQ